MRASAYSFLLEGAAPAEPTDPDGALLWRAWREGTRGAGRTAPNPAVGAAVRLEDGRVVTGFHARAGDRHAEVVALDQVAGHARGATLACTLEPCVHHGRTPPCVDRVLAEGVARVIVGALDENPIVRGRGVARLRDAGVDVVLAEGALAAHARALAAPFVSAVTRARPYVVLKIAASLDGRVAAASGESRWITGAPARAVVHALRDAVDAVLVGAGTVARDDPALTVRDVGAGARAPRDPRRILLDRSLATLPDARAVPGALVLCARATGAAADALRARGAELIEVPEVGGHLDLEMGLSALGARGLQAVLVEAGPGLATALLARGLVDELWWFTAPLLLGADAVASVGALELARPADAARWSLLWRGSIGEDGLTLLCARGREP